MLLVLSTGGWIRPIGSDMKGIYELRTEKLNMGLDPRFQTHVCVFRPFFFPQRINSNIT